MRILTLVVMAYGVNTSLLADGSILKRYYAQCGLSSHAINDRLTQWRELSEVHSSIDNCVRAVQSLLPCKKCSACLYESQNQVKFFFAKKLSDGSVKSDNFERVCKSFIFQQIKTSCKYHRKLRQSAKRNALRSSGNEVFKAFSAECCAFGLIKDRVVKHQDSSVLQEIITQKVLDPFEQHKKMFECCLQDIKFLGFEKEYQACVDQEERDAQEWQALLNSQRYNYFGCLLDMYISSQDPYILNSYTLECAFHLLSSKDFFAWTANHCQELIEAEKEGEIYCDDGDFESFNSCPEDDEFSQESCEDSIDFKEFLAWCEWILDNIDFIRADLDEDSFEHEDPFLYDDCLSSESELSDEDKLELEKSLEDEFFDFSIDPKSRGIRNYLNKKK